MLKLIAMMTMAVLLMTLKMVMHMVRRLGDFSLERAVTKPPLCLRLCFAGKGQSYDGEGDHDCGMIVMQ